jgi:hypothetical protein
MQMVKCPLFSVGCCPGCVGKVKASKLSEHLFRSREGNLETILQLVAKIQSQSDSETPPTHYGVIKSVTGEVYTGDLLHGVKHGQGSMNYQGLTDFYSGQWQNDFRSGYGMKLWPDGASYHGDWLNGAMHGAGIFTYPNGDKYIGEFRNDDRHGAGVLKRFTDDAVLEGEWKNDEIIKGVVEESSVCNMLANM